MSTEKIEPAELGKILNLDTIEGQVRNVEVIGMPDTAHELYRVSVIATANDRVGNEQISRSLMSIQGSFVENNVRYHGVTSQFLAEEPGTTVLFVPKEL